MCSVCKFLLLGNVVLPTFAAYGQQYTNLPLRPCRCSTTGRLSGRPMKRVATNALGFEGGFYWHHAANLSLRYVFREEER